MLNYVAIAIVFNVSMFFSISTLIGQEYGGKDSSPTYIVYNVILFAISLVLFFYDTVLKKERFNKNQLLVLTIPLLFFFNFLISLLFSRINHEGVTFFLYFVLWGTPGILMGVYLSRYERIKSAVKFVEIIMILFSFATIIASLQSITTGDRVSIAGATYQEAAYIAALSFGINLYYLRYGGMHLRYKLATTKLYKGICIVLLPCQGASVLIAGGRGAAVLAIMYLIIIIVSLMSKLTLGRIVKYAVLIIFVIGISIGIFNNLMKIPTFEHSFSRTFSYLSSEGINWSGTSGRDVVYETAINKIGESPLWGHGIFGMFSVLDYYPHNFILEILLQGGIIYLGIITFGCFFFINKYMSLVRNKPYIRVIGILGVYPLIMLMFSGTYTHTSLFWFVLSFVLSYFPNYNERKH